MIKWQIFLVWTAWMGSTTLAWAHGTIEGVIEASPRKYRKLVVVYIKGFHKNREDIAKKVAVMDQKNLLFYPYILPIVVGTTVKFTNNDKVKHNIFSPDFEKYNMGTWGKGESRSHTFKHCKTEVCAYVQLCNVHSEMEAYILVLQSSKFAKADAKGRFRIENVPTGTYELKTWSPKLGSQQIRVVVKKSQTTKVQLKLQRKR